VNRPLLWLLLAAGLLLAMQTGLNVWIGGTVAVLIVAILVINEPTITAQFSAIAQGKAA